MPVAPAPVPDLHICSTRTGPVSHLFRAYFTCVLHPFHNRLGSPNFQRHTQGVNLGPPLTYYSDRCHNKYTNETPNVLILRLLYRVTLINPVPLSRHTNIMQSSNSLDYDTCVKEGGEGITGRVFKLCVTWRDKPVSCQVLYHVEGTDRKS